MSSSVHGGLYRLQADIATLGKLQDRRKKASNRLHEEAALSDADVEFSDQYPRPAESACSRIVQGHVEHIEACPGGECVAYKEGRSGRNNERAAAQTQVVVLKLGAPIVPKCPFDTHTEQSAATGPAEATP